MNINSKIINNTLLLTLNGDLIGEDVGTSVMEVVNNAILDNVIGCVIDFSGVRYMNSSGLGVLITVHTKFKNKSGEVILLNPSPQVSKLLIITKLDTLFSSVDTVEEAFLILK
jgi:anti-sigma B factor antagonist